MTDSELRELDAWIAEHVMGFKWGHFGFVKDGLPELKNEPIYLLPPDRIKNEEFGNANPFPSENVAGWSAFGSKSNLPYYTTCPAAAMEVLEKCGQNLPIGLEISFNGTNWFADRPDDDSAAAVFAETLPLAICLFAKKLFA